MFQMPLQSPYMPPALVQTNEPLVKKTLYLTTQCQVVTSKKPRQPCPAATHIFRLHRCRTNALWRVLLPGSGANQTGCLASAWACSRVKPKSSNCQSSIIWRARRCAASSARARQEYHSHVINAATNPMFKSMVNKSCLTLIALHISSSSSKGLQISHQQQQDHVTSMRVTSMRQGWAARKTNTVISPN